MRRWLRRVWVTAGLTFVLWQLWTMQAHHVAAGVFASSGSVRVVDSGETMQFIPIASSADSAGLIFMPGAMVEPRAYAPLLRAIADAGHPAVLVRLPWRVAPSARDRTHVWSQIELVLAADPKRLWLLAGHSRGAALAAQFAGDHTNELSGLVLIGTTHPKAVSLSALTMPVTKIYGTDSECESTAPTTVSSVGPVDSSATARL